MKYRANKKKEANKKHKSSNFVQLCIREPPKLRLSLKGG